MHLPAEPDEHVGGDTGHVDPQADSRGSELHAQREQLLRRILMPDARMRLNNIRMVRPELADLVEQQLIGLATQGRLQSQITDAQLKQMLLSIQQPRREFKFNRI